MKLFLLIVSIQVSFFYMTYIDEIRKMELLIVDLYFSHFIDYVYVDQNYSIKYDKEKLKQDLKKKGYNVNYKENSWCFSINFKNIIIYEKDYCFYLVKNDDVK